MDTNKLKKFAQEARNQLIAQVNSKLTLVLAEGSAARRETPTAVQELERNIKAASQAQVIEKVAYTWFNRFTALRFMDANGYTNPRVVTPADSQTRPEILADAAAGQMDEVIPQSTRTAVTALLDGRTPSRDSQGEAYRLLLVAACNQWHLLMPFMFEKIADYTELLMPEDLLSPDGILSRLRAVMTDGDCRDVEIIGWLYQFYISEKKDKVFVDLKKNVKISAENIPAATQLFTPHWIVRYLVDNSLGRLWLLNRPRSKLATKMEYYLAPRETEADFIRISRPEEIRICDPACGSGHMLTYAFELLYIIYEEEGYEAAKIPELILTHNLYGVEIDDRAGTLAAFALVMKAAARIGRRRLLRLGVKPNICILRNVTFAETEMQDVAAVVGSDLFTADLRETLMQFSQAKNFGSLIVPKLRDPAEVARRVDIKDFASDLLLRDIRHRLLTVLRMAEFLSDKYQVVVANPPYMGGRGMNAGLASFVKARFPNSSADLMTAFIERCIALNSKMGLSAIVSLDSWMFLTSYWELRQTLLTSGSFCSMAHIGWNCFPEGHTYNRGTAFVFCKLNDGRRGTFIDLSNVPATTDKNRLFLDRKKSGEFNYLLKAEDFTVLPEDVIAYWVTDNLRDVFRSSQPLSSLATPRQGLATADNDRFIRLWAEVSLARIGFGFSTRAEAALSEFRWFPHNKGGEYRKWYGNQTHVINWMNDGSDIFNAKGAVVRNPNTYFRPSLSWSKVTSGGFSLRYYPAGFVYDTAGCCIFLEQNDEKQMAILSLLNSKIMTSAIKRLFPTINLSVGQIAEFPVLELGDTFGVTARNASVLVNLAKADWDASETSWDFERIPLLSPEHRSETMEKCYAKLRHSWRTMIGEARRLEEENNRLFITAYGLENELSSDVSLEEITLSCNPLYRYGGAASEFDLEARLLSDTMAELLHYAVGCMFGRFSLDAPGIILANQGDRLTDYLARVPEPTFLPDEDNVIPVLEGDWFADDITERFRKFLRVTFGEPRFQENLDFIEAALGKDIRKWFTKDFFEYHVRRFKKRPIYWMFSSPKGSFNALIYMHRYRPDTVSVVLNDYLREFISKLQTERVRLEKLSDDPNATQTQRTRALKDVGVVIKQIAELEEWERDVVFPLAQAKIEVDLDDGVKRNYPLFGAALKPIKGLQVSDD